eukprot:CAMPEP_0119299902 /NCGR_PEP_ID=MMETSP1333-20130426/1921_1 /TAXON_ID=418940 /ORGANISM="Scyphosphaera apsteinii, Strain RCC1455" /LENGTH=196 /DNA_ID=CAMNT_0007301493 /DNA_START=39 /DNA_END=629 /DNA_ORIENTATION=+
MSSARQAQLAAEAERARREQERRQFKEAQELENLRRAFKRIDKKNDEKVDVQELMEELEFLGHQIKPADAKLIIWEVDDDADECVDWQEFKTMFYRTRNDQSACEPRKLFNIVEFIMYDRNVSGSIDLDECIPMFYQRFGREPVDEKVKELCGNDKNIGFTIFDAIQKHAFKHNYGSKIKPGQIVPRVKPYVESEP